MLTEANINTVIADIIKTEGGFVDDPADPGGATNFGITQDTANQYGLGDVRGLTAAQASAAYRNMFTDWKIDQIPDIYTFWLVADSCVNHGPGNGIRFLQTALHLPADGVIGPKTLTALVSNRDWQQVYASVLALRLRFYGYLVESHPTDSKFDSGWMNRVAAFVSPWPVW